MKKELLIAMCAIAMILPVQAEGQRTIELPDVVAGATRPLNDIGIQRTVIDSLALKENIAQSMADVLAYNSGLFVKNHGRATLSTVAFRGTSPSHTAVTWNGMEINSPMLGMTDFSLIPSYFIDKTTLLHGSSSVGQIGGGLGGAVQLSTSKPATDGWDVQYVQGIGSYASYDEFLKIGYSGGRWHSRTRAVVSSSENDYTYRNHDKKENIYDENHHIVGQYYPKERNRNAAFHDFHLLHEIYYDTHARGEFGLKLWYVDSRRELPLLTVDYTDDLDFVNEQSEQTFRGVATWNLLRNSYRMEVDGGYSFTDLHYDYKRDSGNGEMKAMTRSRSYAHTIYGNAVANFYLKRTLLVEIALKAHQYLVKSYDINPFAGSSGNTIFGYDKGRLHLTGAVTARWRPFHRWGLGVTLREELVGKELTPLIPAVFADYTAIKRCNLVIKASASRNVRYPSLNDLYFLPGGNSKLRHESGWSYDLGAQISIGKAERYALTASVSWFDSHVDDWIEWLPTSKGFFSPRNVKSVHSYGVEIKTDLTLNLGKGWRMNLDGAYSWTPSVNDGEKYSPADNSVGRQLPYIPKVSASLNGRLSWRDWTLHYKWLHYSRRYTQSSNADKLSGTLPTYYMNVMSLERMFRWRPLDLSVKFVINNLFDEEYLSVLSRPMPGINFEAFFSFTPKW